MEFRLTQLAEEKIKEISRFHNEAAILRIYIEKATCYTARFGIAFDNIKENDEVTEVNGIKFITDTQYLPEYTNGIYIDYVTEPKEGFLIESIHQVIKTGGGCGGGCGSSSGGCSGCSH